MTAMELQINLSPIRYDNGNMSPAIPGLKVKVKMYGLNQETFDIKYAAYDSDQDCFLIVIDKTI